MRCESAETMLRRRITPLRLVIFDCDGVLIDSEAVANRVTAAEVTALGWPMAAEESERRFLGLSLADMRSLIEAHLAHPLPPSWEAMMAARIAAAMATEARLVPGAMAALEATEALGLDWRVASNSGHLELAAKFARTGLMELTAGRVHSADDVIARGGRGKPAPDLFLAAAAASGVAPSECLVIEDSLPGVRGAITAGMTCLGFTRHRDAATFRSEGVATLHDLGKLGALLPLGIGPRP